MSNERIYPPIERRDFLAGAAALGTEEMRLLRSATDRNRHG